jgi:hypothetical protein
MFTSSARDLSGLEKAAVLLLALGPQKSTRLISGLTPREVARLADQLARVHTVDDETRTRVLREFRQAIPADPPSRRFMSPPSRPPETKASARLAAAGEAPAEPRAPAGGSIRPYNFAALDKIAPSALRRRRPLSAPCVELLAETAVLCRARLAAFALSLTEVAGLRVNDVLLLGPASEPDVALVAGDDCRFRGRLLIRDGHLAVEIAPEDGTAGGNP